MSDLISRQAIYNILHGLGGCDAQDEWAKGWDRAIDTAIDGLGDIPTAYDVDKVVDQLKSESFCGDFGGNYIDIDEAIEIVKGGGQG